MFRKRISTLWFVALLLFVLAVTGVAAQDDVAHIVWWTESGFPAEHMQEAFVDPFNAAHENIELEVVAQENLNETLRTAILAGAGPDIVQLGGPDDTSELASAGLLLPLSDYSEENNWQELLLPWAYNAGLLGDELYSIPLNFESMILFYNETLFEEHGWTPPTTLAEFESLAAEITEAGIHPLAYGNAGGRVQANGHLLTAYLNNTMDPATLRMALVGEKSWTDPEFYDTITLFNHHLIDNGWFAGSINNYYALSDDDAWAELSSGQAAMIMTGTWGFEFAANYFPEDADMQWDWAPLPSLTEVDQPTNYVLAIGSNISINAESPNPDAAAAAIDFLMRDSERALNIASGQNFGAWMVPLGYNSEDFPEGTDERVARFYEDFAAVTNEGRYGYSNWTFWPGEANASLRVVIEQVWEGEMTIEDYLAQHQAVWDELRAEGRTIPIP